MTRLVYASTDDLQTDPKVNISQKLTETINLPLVLSPKSPVRVTGHRHQSTPTLRPNRHPSSLNNLLDGPRRRKSRSRCGQHVLPHSWTRRKTNCSWTNDGLLVWIYTEEEQ